MTITVNDQAIDFTLESERTLGEVLSELRNWVEDAGLRIRSIESNGEDLDLAQNDSWDLVSLETIDRVSVVALTPVEFYREKLESLYQYFELIRDYAQSKSEAASGLLLERSSVAELLSETISPEAATMFLNVSNPGSESNLPEFSDKLLPLIEERYEEITQPMICLERALPQFRESTDELSEVAAYLQNGEDTAGMHKVLRFIELAQKILRIVGFAKELQKLDSGTLESIEANQMELNGLLGELGDAISSGDTVTIGDLLEYEIGPRFAGIVAIFDPPGEDS